MIEFKDLIKDNYYVGKYGKDEYLIRFDGNENCYSDYIYPVNKDRIPTNFTTRGSFRDREFIYLRNASNLEVLWLNRCIEKRTLVAKPMDEIINNYEIY